MENKYIEKILRENINNYAHKKQDNGNSIKELLLSHMELTYNYYLEMEEYKNLDKLVINIIQNLIRNKNNNVEESTIKKVYELFKSAIYYHDIGKLNPNFQRVNMDNNINPDIKGSTEHSLISAIIYLDASEKEIYEDFKLGKYNKKDFVFLKYIIYYFSYIISRHHSRLTNMENYLTKLSIVELFDIYKLENDNNSDFLQTKLESFISLFKIDEILLYILCELLYSCLVTADFLATTEFMNNRKIEIKREKNNELFKNYENSELFEIIEKYKNKNIKLSGINKLRSDMYIESEKNIKNNLDKIIYYLEAPTGSGKTNMAINLARILYKNNESLTSINYIFPFNTLIDQTKNTFKNYFKEYENFIVINSCTPIVDEKSEILNYEIAYIKSEFRQYDIKLTSHVNLFDTIFGISKEGKYNFYDLANSIIVLDEIQAYSNKIWRDMIILLYKFAKYLNIKIIIMSATLPKLDYLLKDYANYNNKLLENSEICSLIENKEKYFENKLFKERVKLDFSLLNEDENNIIDILINKVLENKNKKILIEFITKKSSSLFYKKLKELNVENVYELTGDDNSYTREKIINKVKEEKNIILVATQTIEAGVDIDMDIGFKDISFLDSEEQFLGRINRSSKKENCIAYFFYFDDENKIYKNDYRAEYTIKEENIRDILKIKNFEKYYKNVMDKIYKNTEKNNSNNISNLFNYCGNLNFQEINNRLQLIDNNTRSIFLNYTININGEKIIGSEIWKKYKELILDNKISYAKKQIELSKLKPKFNLFIYSIYKNKNSNINYYDEEFGGIYYINNGDEFVHDGKFDREKYISYTGGIFL